MKHGEGNKRRKVVAIVVSMVAVVAVCVIVFFVANSSSCARQRAKWDSEYGYGIERTVRLYSFEGELIDEWSGKIDVSYRDDNRVDLLFFNENDEVAKRVVINVGLGQLVVEQDD